MHRRRIVRDAAVEQLRGLPLTGQRVFNSRSIPVPEDRLPAIRIYTPTEARDPNSDLLGDSGTAHRIELRVEVLAKAADRVENEIDEICEQIEAAIRADETLGGVTQWCAYQATEIEYEDEDQTVMQATLSFEATHIQE